MKRIGLTIAVIVASFLVLELVSELVVDWAWFSTIGFLDVFWTVFAAKAFLFVAVFAVSTVLLWVNATLAVRFASQQHRRVLTPFAPGYRQARPLFGRASGD